MGSDWLTLKARVSYDVTYISFIINLWKYKVTCLAYTLRIFFPIFLFNTRFPEASGGARILFRGIFFLLIFIYMYIFISSFWCRGKARRWVPPQKAEGGGIACALPQHQSKKKILHISFSWVSRESNPTCRDYCKRHRKNLYKNKL